MPIRRALAYGDVPFDDERITGEEFTKRKMGGKLTFGSLPVMEIDGEMLAESDALLRYVGKLTGLYPEDPVEAVKVDMVMDALGTMSSKSGADSSEKARKEFVKNDIPRYTTPINDLYGKSDGPYLLGEKLSIADLKVNMFVDFLKSGMLDHIPTDSLNAYEHIMAASKSVEKEPKIAAWIEAHQKK